VLTTISHPVIIQFRFQKITYQHFSYQEQVEGLSPMKPGNRLTRVGTVLILAAVADR